LRLFSTLRELITMLSVEGLISFLDFQCSYCVYK
jgi:hypothetical protein